MRVCSDSRRTTASPLRKSRAAVGSSASTIEGRCIKARAIAAPGTVRR